MSLLLGFVYFAFPFWVQTSAVWLAAWHFVVCLEEGEGGVGDGEGEKLIVETSAAPVLGA